MTNLTSFTMHEFTQQTCIFYNNKFQHPL